MKYTLDGQWQFSFTHPVEKRRVASEATVPGNVEIELERLGLIEDCMPADEEFATHDFERVDDWTFERMFDAPVIQDGWTQEIVFEGVDTIAEVYLNGEKIGDCCDMHIAYRFDVSGRLKARDNALRVIIRSSELWARGQERDVFALSRAENGFYDSQTFLRKARHEWGWDNAPRLKTAGMYRSVYIESLPPERFGDVYLYTASVDEKNVGVGIAWNFISPEADLAAYQLRCTIMSGGEIAYQEQNRILFTSSTIRASMPREKVRLWWPQGMGEPSMSHVKLEMLHGDTVCAQWESDWGIRTLRLVSTGDVLDDNTGEFHFVVNGEKVFIRGTNWKPLDALHSRADAKVERALEMAKDLNCNMIRIWGGGIYEDTPFFDYCDRNGLMVWQDFMFACEFPTTEDWYCELVRKETDAIIRKLRNHASLAIWCGDNEDDQCMSWVHAASTIVPSDNRITREILCKCVMRNDPYRSYVESSPYVSDACINDRRAGKITHYQTEDHLYPPTIGFSKTLRELRSRFIGETGPIIVNAMTDNERIWKREENRARRLWDEPLAPEKRNLLCHQQDVYFQSWRQTGGELCKAWYGCDFTADDYKTYALAINIICADVFKDVIEYCRCERWNKTGVIWWSLMDMWPMLFNYSVIDYDFVPKMPYYWIRQSQLAFALMVVRKEVDGEVALYAANDTRECQKGEYRITAVNAQGETRMVATGAYCEPANEARMLQRLVEADEPELWLVEWTGADSAKQVNHFVTGKRPYDFAAWKRWTDILAKEYRINA